MPDLTLVDCRCRHPRCDEQNAYRMIGHCTNCGRTGLLGLFSARHEVGQGVLGRAVCPSCGNQTCRWDRLATPDEVPGPPARHVVAEVFEVEDEPGAQLKTGTEEELGDGA